jgi:hypothetical protein
VSTGAAWGTSIDPATLPRLAANNTFTGTNAFTGIISITGDTTFYNSVTVNGTTISGGGILANNISSSTDLDLHVNAAAGKILRLNWDSGGALSFGSGSGTEVGYVDNVGNAHFNGDISAGSKSFRIQHPLDKKKTLMHGCLEGPEHAVYYRGRATTKKGVATVNLPAYFEALTEKEGRTVQLTQVAEPEDEHKFSMAATSRVKDGKFKIMSVEPSVTVYWEVKAIRKGVAIEVESDREAA